jgi:hypothetical protein
VDTNHSISSGSLFRNLYCLRPFPPHGLLTRALLLFIFTFGASLCESPSSAQSIGKPGASYEQAEAGILQEPRDDRLNALDESKGTRLFDGETLGQWESTDFGGKGLVYVWDDAIYMAMGNSASGITWKGPLIRMNYELTLEAMRDDGYDFFCGLTFPVGESHCSLILGGWGGSLVGLSSIDGFDASNNETTQFIPFENFTWYQVRLQVTPVRIKVWLDDEEIINVATSGRTISTRPEVNLSKPLGIATWNTIGAVRNIYMRPFEKEDLQ